MNVESFGLVYALERIEHWFSQAVEAKIKDYQDTVATPGEVGAWAAVELLRRAQTSCSSGAAGTRMLDQAEIGVLAKIDSHSPARFVLTEQLKEQERSRSGESAVRQPDSAQR